MDDQQLGELIGTVRSIKENTDRIPDISITLALHEARIAAMEPKVEQHEKTTQRAFGIAAICGTLAGIIGSLVRSTSH